MSLSFICQLRKKTSWLFKALYEYSKINSNTEKNANLNGFQESALKCLISSEKPVYMENTQINPGLPTKLLQQIKLHKTKSYTLKASTADASAKHNFTWTV